MDERLTIGIFLLGCVIVIATILGFNRIEKLEDTIVKQHETIQLQNQAIQLQRVENTMLRNVVYPSR